MSPRDRSPVRTSSPRQPSGKDQWDQWSPYTLTLLQLEQTTGSSGQRGTTPPLSPVSPKVFSPVCHRWSLGSPGLLGWGYFISRDITTWLHRYYLNWTKLDDDFTEFNNEMPLTENLVILHKWYTIFRFWYFAVALTQFVLLKALYK